MPFLIKRLLFTFLPSYLRDRLNNAHKDHKRIVTGMATVALFVVAAKLVAAGKEVLVAYRYGTSGVVDGYLFVFNLINWPVSLYLSVMSAVLIPLAARIQRTAPETVGRFRSELLGVTLIIAFGLSLFSMIILPLLLKGSWTGLDMEARTTALRAAPWMAITLWFGILSALFSAWVMSREVHANSFLQGLPALGIAIALLLWPGADVTPLVWGTVAGFALQMFLLAIIESRSVGTYKPEFRVSSEHWKSFARDVTTMVVAQAIITATGLLDQFFAAHLGEGAIATLSYANRILALVLGLSATVIGRAVLPVFARARIESGPSFLNQMAWRWSIIMFIAGLPVVVVGWWLAPWGVALLFERGAFSANDTEAVAGVFRILLVQVPLYLPNMVLVNWANSTGAYRHLLYTSVLGASMKLVGNTLLVQKYGLNGIAAATVLRYLITTGYLVLIRTQRASLTLK